MWKAHFLFKMGLAGAIILALTASVWAILNMQRIPPPHGETVRDYMASYEAGIHEHHGPPIPERFHEILAEWDKHGHNPLAVSGRGLGTAGLDRWLQERGQELEELARLSTEGITNHLTFSRFRLDGEVPWRHQDPASYLMLIGRGSIHRALAVQAMEAAVWEEALRQLRYHAEIGNPLRVHSLNGSRAARLNRDSAYRGYLLLLAHDVPREVLEQGLADLRELQETDPVWDDWILHSERNRLANHLLMPTGKVQDPLEAEWLDLPHDVRFDYLMGGAAAAILQVEELRTPRLRRFAERHHSLVEAIVEQPYHSTTDVVTRTGWRWTITPGFARFVRGVIESEPALFDDYLVPFEELDRSGKWTSAVYLGAGDWRALPYVDDYFAGMRNTQTLGALTRQAYENRLHYEDTGEWPETELEPGEVSSIMEDYKDQDQAPYLPLQSRVLQGPLSPVHMGILLRQTTPLAFLRPGDIRVYLDDGVLTFSAVFPTQLPAERMLRLPEYFETYASELEASIVTTGHIDWTGFPPPPSDQEMEFWDKYVGVDAPMPAPLTREHAENMARVHEAMWSYTAEHDYSHALLGLARKTVLQITGTLHPPEDVRVLWSPGPDGVDGRAAVPYDPTNGTLSTGDIIVFPERFR